MKDSQPILHPKTFAVFEYGTRNDGFSAFIQFYVQMFPFLVCDKRHNSPRSTTFKLAVQSPHIISLLCRQH